MVVPVSMDTMLSVPRLTSGRRLQVYERMYPVAEELGHKTLLAKLDLGMAHEQHTRSLDDGWLAFAGRRADYTANVPRIDMLMDRTLRGFRDSARGTTHALPADDPRHQAAGTLLEQCFPGGLRKLINLPYVDQIAAVENLVTRLTTDLAPQVQAAGLGPHVEQIARLAAEYREAVNLGKNQGFAPVRDARRRGHEIMLEIVAIIVGTYHDSDSPKHMAARSELLAPLIEQLAIMKSHRRTRRGRDEDAGMDDNGTDNDTGMDEDAGTDDDHDEPDELVADTRQNRRAAG